MAEINNVLKGKTIKNVMFDKDKLIIETTDFHQARIVWKENRPVLEGVDVGIVLTGLQSIAISGFGKT